MERLYKMPKEVRLPKLGQTMEEGTILACKVRTDNQVKRGDILFEIETDKATLELESPAEGFVKKILVKEGQTVPIGEVILILGEKDEKISDEFILSLKKNASSSSAADAPVTKHESDNSRSSLPNNSEIDPPETNLKNIQNITIKENNLTFKGEKTSDIKLGDRIPLNSFQKITAQKMLYSKQNIPCFYLTVKADVTELADFRSGLNKDSSIKISYNDFFIRAIAFGLQHFPLMTGQFEGDTVKLADTIGIGLAIDSGNGLVAPIIKDADKKDIFQIAKCTSELIKKTRNKKLSPDDLGGGCITISNLGAYGIDFFIPIVIPGQSSILGIGQISDTYASDNDNILIRKTINLTLSVDHKVTNGAYAAQFLDYTKKLLENPNNLK